MHAEHILHTAYKNEIDTLRFIRLTIRIIVIVIVYVVGNFNGWRYYN